VAAFWSTGYRLGRRRYVAAGRSDWHRFAEHVARGSQSQGAGPRRADRQSLALRTLMSEVAAVVAAAVADGSMQLPRP